MATAPLIGLTMSISVGKKPERVHLNTSYVKAVQQAGGVPILLPPHLAGDARRELFQRLDGLLLTGGADVDPHRFNEAPHPTVSDVSPERDELEIDLVAQSLDDHVPVLAICRGIQVLNVALGGSLHQDVKSAPGTDLEHSQKSERHETTHTVTIEPDSRLAEVLGVTEVAVNSFHHQTLNALGRGLRAVAFATDGLVEGAEGTDRAAFVLGVQWHPEDLVGHDDAARRLFTALVRAAAGRH